MPTRLEVCALWLSVAACSACSTNDADGAAGLAQAGAAGTTLAAGAGTSAASVGGSGTNQGRAGRNGGTGQSGRGGTSAGTSGNGATGDAGAAGSFHAPSSGTHWVMGYHVGYQKDLYPTDAIEWSGLTHLAVGRVTPNNDGSLDTTYDLDASTGPAWAKQVTAAAHAHDKKVVLMIGGEGAYGWASASASGTRSKFVKNLYAVMDDVGADGLDLDWEPVSDSDEPLLAALVSALRSQRPNAILTMPILWLNANSPDDVSPIYAQIAPELDQLNSMTYSMAGQWDGWQSWHTSALGDGTGSHPSSIESTVDGLLASGVPAAKLGFGVGFYGSCWSLPVSGPRQKINGADADPGDNSMSYANIMKSYYSQSAYKWDDAASVPYLSFSKGTGPNNCAFVSYDDERSVTAKADYIKSKGLGGLIVWTVGQGYLPNAAAGARNPLLTALAPLVSGQ